MKDKVRVIEADAAVDGGYLCYHARRRDGFSWNVEVFGQSDADEC